LAVEMLPKKSWSIVNLKASSSILGINFFNILLDYSRQGFVLTSMSQGCPVSSIIKSYPKISKENLRLFSFNLLQVEFKDI